MVFSLKPSRWGDLLAKPAWPDPNLPVRQCTQTGADRRRQDILATHGYENTDWFFSMVLCVFMVNAHDKKKMLSPPSMKMATERVTHFFSYLLVFSRLSAIIFRFSESIFMVKF